jgi:hypothetical protein
MPTRRSPKCSRRGGNAIKHAAALEHAARVYREKGARLAEGRARALLAEL